MQESEKKFHKSRIAFMIINKKIVYLENSEMGHFEWYLSLGYEKDNFNNIVRGYYRDGRIIFYKGDFIYDEEVIILAKNFQSDIKKYVNDEAAEVYVGVKKGKVGEAWEPELKIE